MKRVAFAIALSLSGCAGDQLTGQPAPKPVDPCLRPDLDPAMTVVPHTPRWAFEPWISKDISNRADTYAYVDGFRERGIPVGAVVLDSPWETHYNTFVPNPARYGDFPSLIADMHSRSVRVVLWMTPLVNEQSFDFEVGGDKYEGPSPNLEEGRACNYFVDEAETYVWWKGRGAAVDFFNPSARAWWHRQQDPVLRMGVDGWKLDFGESYVKNDPLRTADGPKAHQVYSERYYEDFLAYGRSVRGPDFVTMVRAWDASYEYPGRFFAKKEHAPVSWMGDNTRDWPGLIDALDHMFVSARAGYLAVGSDIGGYLDHDDKNLLGPEIPFDTLNFARWTAVGALTPFMQLHGRGNIAPWTMPDHADETVALYKYWATLHHALVPFFFSLSEKAYATGAEAEPLVRPVGDAATWANDYRYQLGDAFLVAPLLDATGKRSVALPAGVRWYDWWSGTAYEGGAVVPADFANDRGKIPLYVRAGAIVPLDVENGVLGLATNEPGTRTILAYPAATPSSFEIHEADGAVVNVGLQRTTTSWTVTLSSVPKSVVLHVRSDVAPTEIVGQDVVSSYDASRRTAVVQVGVRAGGVTITARNP